MDLLSDLCCICLKDKSHLRRLSKSYENTNYYSRLVLLFPEMISTVLYNQGGICYECCINVDGFYKFRKQCLQNFQTYINYTSQLSLVSETSDELCIDVIDLKAEHKDFLRNCEQSENQCNSIDILPGCDKTDYIPNEAMGKNDNNSQVEADREDNGTRYNAIDDVYLDNSPTNIITELIDIKSEPTDTIKCEGELETAAIANTESRDPLETYCTSSTGDTSHYNYNTNIMITEDINIKSEFRDDSEYGENTAGEDAASATSSDNADESWVPISVNKLTQINKIQTLNMCYKGDVCEKTFAKSEDLVAHKPVHVGEKRFKCEQCPKAFLYISHLISHKRIHCGEKPLKCEYKKSFSERDKLIYRKRVLTGVKPFKCNQCDRAFAVSSHLINHKRIHSGEKPFKCDQCNKAFTVSSNLSSHKRIHSGEKPFKCDECDKVFSKSSNLNSHKRIHSSEKPFKCEECNKTFAQKVQLFFHKRIHSGEKPFKCDQCNKAYARSSDILRHKLVHSEEKPFKCKHCNKEFSYPSSFIRHERTHSNVGPYKCDQCDKAFSVSAHLTTHKLIHSGTERNTNGWNVA